MSYSSSRYGLRGGTLALLTCVSTGVFAQDAPPSSTKGGGLEQVVVTARRSEEGIQSVPVTITALTAESLRESSVSRVNDLQFQTPGVFLQGSAIPENSAYSIRGQGLSVAGDGVPGVVTYFAEVPLPVLSSAGTQYDMASIQVLKGPQGTLFGRNTTGGAVLLSPAAPTNEFEGYAQITAGNYNLREGEAAINIPLLKDKAALRLAGHMIRRDGYTETIGAGDDADDAHTDDFRVSLLLTPTEWFRNTTIFDYSRTDSHNGAQIFWKINQPVAAGIDAALGALGVPPGLFLADLNRILAAAQANGPFKRESNIPTALDITARGLTNRTEIELGSNGTTLTNIFGYRSIFVTFLSNLDGVGAAAGPGCPGTGGSDFLFCGQLLDAFRLVDFHQYSNETQLRGRALDDKLSWLVGAFYFDSKPHDTANALQNNFFFPAPTAYRYYEEKSEAGYVNFAYQLDTLLHGLALNLGYRYTKDKVEVCEGTNGLSTIDSVSNGDCRDGALSVFSTNEGSFIGRTWNIGLDWQATDDLFFYVTSRRGFKAGGVNSPKYRVPDATNPNPNPLLPFQKYEPEEVTDVEVGIRSNWQLGEVQARANVSAFRAKSTDRQVSIVGIQPLPVCPQFDGGCNPATLPFNSTMILNFGDLVVQGIDADITVAPTQHLRFNVGGTVLDTDTKKIDPSVATLAPVLLPVGYSIDRIPVDATPKKTAIAGVRYDVPLGNVGDLVFNVDWFWSSKFDLVAVEVPSYNVTNARIDLNDIRGMPLDFSLFARNVTDKEYIVTSSNPTGASPYWSVAYGAPRLWGAQFRYRF